MVYAAFQMDLGRDCDWTTSSAITFRLLAGSFGPSSRPGGLNLPRFQ
jgi:hypothetical protein